MYKLKYLDGTPVENGYAEAIGTLVAGAAAATEIVSEDELEEYAARTSHSTKPTYSVQRNVGQVKYLVNFHDGQKTHRDGSPFSDVRTFKNKQMMDAFVNDLRVRGFSEGTMESDAGAGVGV